MADAKNGAAQAPASASAAKNAGTEVKGGVAVTGAKAQDGVSPRATSAQLVPGGPVRTGSTASSSASEFKTVDGAITDRPPARNEDVVLPTTAGSAPPFGDQITQGGTAGPPDGVTADAESVAADQAASAARVTRTFDAKHYTHSRQILTEEKLASMSRPSILAVASDRGYRDVDVGGKRAIVRNFLAAQDRELEGENHGLHAAGTLEDAAREDAAASVTGPIGDEYQEGAAEKSAKADEPRATRTLPPRSVQ